MGCINATSLRRKSGQMGHPFSVTCVASTVAGHDFAAGCGKSLLKGMVSGVVSRSLTEDGCPTSREKRARLLRRQPFVKIGAARRVHVTLQLLQARLLLRAALQNYLQPVQLHIRRGSAAVVAGVGQRVDCTGQSNPGGAIYRLGQARHFLRQDGIDCANAYQQQSQGKYVLPARKGVGSHGLSCYLSNRFRSPAKGSTRHSTHAPGVYSYPCTRSARGVLLPQRKTRHTGELSGY
jgi:hypothetical protein